MKQLGITIIIIMALLGIIVSLAASHSIFIREAAPEFDCYRQHDSANFIIISYDLEKPGDCVELVSYYRSQGYGVHETHTASQTIVQLVK